MRWFAVLISLCALASARAELVSARGDLVERDRELTRVIELVNVPTGHEKPAALTATIVVQAGAAYTKVDVISPQNADPTILARVLDRWNTEIGGRSEAVQYFSEDGQTQAETEITKGRWFQRTATNAVRVGQLIQDFHAAGIPCQCFVRVPLYLTTRDTSTRFFREIAGARILDASGFGPTKTLTLSSSLDQSRLAQADFMFFFPPGWAVGSLIIILGFSKWSTRPNPERVRALFGISTALFSVGICAHAFFGIWLAFSKQLLPVLDLWFGSKDNMMLFGILTYSLFLIAPVPILVTFYVQARLQPGPKAAIEYVAKVALPEWIGPWSGFVAIVALAPLALYGSDRAWQAALPVGIVLIYCLPKLLPRMFRWSDHMLSARYPGVPQVALVDQIATNMGVKVRKVSFLDGGNKESELPVFYYSNTLRMKNPAFSALSLDEQEFAIAYAMARHTRYKPSWSIWAMLSVLGLLVLVATVEGLKLLPRGVSFALTVICLPVGFYLLGDEPLSEADRLKQVLAYTRKIGPAHSYLNKLDDLDTASRDPYRISRGRSKRGSLRRDLERAASELGLA